MTEKNILFAENTPDAQKNAITATNSLITAGAGAGTGKTWVLSNRYVNLLLTQSEILPCDILTLTFTEAAAIEMQKRIEARIKNLLEQNSKLIPEKRRRAILEGMADTWISTIHSFAVKIIHEAGLSLDIDPSASVIPEHQTQEFWNSIENAVNFANMRALANSYGEKVLRDNAKKLDDDKLLSAAVAKWGADKLRRLAQLFYEMHSNAGHTWEEMLAQIGNDDEIDTLLENSEQPTKKILLREWERLYDFWDAIPDLNSPKAKSNSAKNFFDFIYWLKGLEKNYDDLKRFYSRLILDTSLKSTNGEPFQTLKNYLNGLTLAEWRRQQAQSLKIVSEDFINELTPEKSEIALRKSLLRFCIVAWGMWDNMKTQRGRLTFSDMIIHAKNAIENGSVKRVFSHVLVDEFQDTDPLQFKMIKAIANLNNASLFAVGDPKQSIYRFRHAEPSLFAETVEQAKTQGAKIELDVSFRTRRGLLDKINKLFASIWRYGLGNSEAMSNLKYEPLKTPAFLDLERDKATVPELLIILANSKNYDSKKDLANALASKLAEFFNLGLTIWDKDNQKLRALKFSDIAILMRDRLNYDLLEEVFNAHGIKTIQDQSRGFFNRGEILDVIATLNAAADFNDKAAVTGWLMSPLSGVDEKIAIKILKLVDEDNPPIEIIKKHLPESYERLKFLKLKGEIDGAAGLLSIFDKNRHWLQNYAPNERLRVLRNLRRAVVMAGNFQQSGTASLKACAEWLSSAVKKSESMDEASWHSEDENAILLSTVHAAKGLEYPVTVIFEPRGKSHRDLRTGLAPSKNLGLVFSSYPDEMNVGDAKILSLDREKLFSEQGENEEDLRLFYVAATRAEDSLIFCGLTNSDGEAEKGTWTKILLANNPGGKIINAEECGNFKVKTKKANASQKVLKHIKINKPENFLQQVSATSFALYEFCEIAWRRKYLQGCELEWSALEIEENEIDFERDNNFVGGADLGSLAHWILARWPINNNYESELDYYLNDRSILDLLPVDLRAVWRDKSVKKFLSECLINFASSPYGSKIISAGKNIQREKKFRLNFEGIILTGSIDALYKNPDGEFEILDYKTSSQNNAPLEIYKNQLEFYAFAVHKIFNTDKIKPVIIFLRDDKKFFSVNISHSFAEIGERIKNFARSCSGDLITPAYNKCSKCAYSGGCIVNANANAK